MALKILSVDDSRVIRTLVKKAFQPYDVEIDEAENGAEGLAKVSSSSPDIIILDVAMPIMTGIEMLEKLKADAKFKKIPVVMLTAEAGQKEVMRILQLGASGYLLKPFKSEQLLDRVTKLVTLSEKTAVAGSVTDVLAQLIHEEDGVMVIASPAKITRVELTALEKGLPEGLRTLLASKRDRVVLDLRNTSEVTMSLVKFMAMTLHACHEVSVRVAVLGTASLGRGLSSLEETKNIPVFYTMETAQASFSA